MTTMTQMLSAKQFLNQIPHAVIELITCRYWVRREQWLHRAPKAEALKQHFLVFVEQGRMAFEVDGRRVEVGAGECIWIQPGQERAVLGAANDEVLRHINLRLTLTRQGAALACSRNMLHIRAAQSLHRYFCDFLEFYQTPGLLPEQKSLALTLSLMGDAIRLDKGARSRQRDAFSSHQRQLLMRYMTEHLHEGISPADLAAAVDLSLDYFSRCFSSVYGVPPRRYLLEERMRQAAVQLIETNLPIYQVASQVGIDDSNYFCRQFKKVMRCTPGDYRRHGQLPEALY